MTRLIVTVSLLLASGPFLCAQTLPDGSLTPREVFERASPSVFVVEALDGDGSVRALGSAVAIDASDVVTNHHVVDGAVTVRLRQGNKHWAASVSEADPKHDFCRISAPNLGAYPAIISSVSKLRVGDRVYAIGAPEGLELTLSEGLVSGLRSDESGESLIQTSAAISHGSSGGGLFNSKAELVGITTFYVKDGQNLNFAIPSDWILHKTATMQQKRALPTTRDTHQLLQEGQDAFEAGDWQRAIVMFEQVTNQDPNDWVAWQRLGDAYLRTDHTMEAFECLKHAVGIKPDFGSAWRDLGWAASRLASDQPAGSSSRLEKASAAEGYLKKSLVYSPNDPDVWQYYGDVLGIQDRHVEAIDALKRSLQLRPGDSTVLFGLGGEYCLVGDRHNAKEVYRQLQAISTDSAKNFFAMAVEIRCLKN
jgi:Flp pilus assembly protein TadD